MLDVPRKDESVSRLVCLQSGRDIHNEALGKDKGDVRTCLMDLLMTLLWSSIRKELK